MRHPPPFFTTFVFSCCFRWSNIQSFFADRDLRWPRPIVMMKSASHESSNRSNHESSIVENDLLMTSWWFLFLRPESSCFSMPPGKLCTELQRHHGSKLGAGCFCWGKTRLALLCGPTASFGHSAHDTRCRMVRISTWFVIGNGLLLNSWTSNCWFVSYSKLDTSRSNRAACLRMTVQKLAESTTKLGVRPKAAQKNCIYIFAAPKKNTQITNYQK